MVVVRDKKGKNKVPLKVIQFGGCQALQKLKSTFLNIQKNNFYLTFIPNTPYDKIIFTYMVFAPEELKKCKLFHLGLVEGFFL